MRSLLLLALYIGLDSLCKLVPVRRRDVVVVVRLDAIGDFFVWMQSGALDVSEYAKRDGRKAVLVANHLWADYARGTRLWDEVLAVDPGRLTRDMWYRLASFVRVRRLGARVLIQPRASRIFRQEDAIARISGADLRIGNAGTLANITPRLRVFGNRFYERLIHVDETGTVHETVRNDQFVFGLTGRHSMPFEFSATAAPPRDPSVVIALGAGHVGRMWPVEKLALLLQHLRSRYPTLRIVLLGTEADLSTGGWLQQLSGGGLEDLVGKTSLQEYVELIAAASLVICNETSAYHIAMSFRRNVVCLLGGGHYGLFAPYPAGRGSDRAITLNVPMDCFGCNWKCKYPPEPNGAYRCVASISVDSAIRASDEMLEQARGL